MPLPSLVPTRRGVLLGGAALAAAAALPAVVRATTGPVPLRIATRTLDIDGRAASVLGLLGPDGRPGLVLDRADGFDVELRNEGPDPEIVHWHGLTPPFSLDGNRVAQAPLLPGEAMRYAFPLARGGTNWMHGHHGLSEGRLLAAPLVVRDGPMDREEVVLTLSDFSFTPPEEILAGLQRDGGMVGSGIASWMMGLVRSRGGMDHGAMGGMGGMDHSRMGGMGMGDMDLNDVAFDAFLANDRTLSDPEVVRVERGAPIRLRVINAATATNFWLDLGGRLARLVAVDGMPVRPVEGTRFEIAMAQRLDLEIDAPTDGTALPVLAQREGDTVRTGLVIAPAGAPVYRIEATAPSVAPPVGLAMERRLEAVTSLPDRSTDRAVELRLTGDMRGYVWGLDGRTWGNHVPVRVAEGARVEIAFRNETMMSHPMHLHGHHFQVVGLGRARLRGAMRDVVVVPPMESVTVAFDADNRGDWPLHCHNLYHREAGMMTTLSYV